LLIFFDLGGRLTLTDLPGYGYAEAPKSTVDNWTRLVDAYLRGRAPLRRVLLLVDARRGIKDIDREIMSMLDRSAVSYQVILTKCDKLKPAPLAGLLARTVGELVKRTACHPEVLTTSARNHEGIAELRAALAELALPEPLDHA
jgi:GTP-binding protein